MNQTSDQSSELIPDHILAVIRYSKVKDADINGLIKVLNIYYSSRLTRVDVINILLEITDYILKEDRFNAEVLLNKNKIILSPINGSFNISSNVFGPKLDDTYSVKEYLDSIIQHIFIQISLIKIGWCRKQLYPGENNE